MPQIQEVIRDFVRVEVQKIVRCMDWLSMLHVIGPEGDDDKVGDLDRVVGDRIVKPNQLAKVYNWLAFHAKRLEKAKTFNFLEMTESALDEPATQSAASACRRQSAAPCRSQTQASSKAHACLRCPTRSQ